jgi:dTDP-4-dehydrorhamnose reductase
VKFLITGANGLVGRAVTRHLTVLGEEVAPFDHHSLDISDANSVNAELGREMPDVVINCAAWTDVDGCELNPDRAQTVNALGPELLAAACRDIHAQLITISTDYVFDGTKEGFYTQRDQPNPLSAYGRAKLNGERRATIAWARTIVVRSGYIFGAGGTNFLSTVVQRARREEPLRAISDMWGTPTYAVHLAARLYRLAQLDLPGIYHVVNGGAGVSFEGFARAALEAAGLDAGQLSGISLNQLNRPALRPRNSRLRCLVSEAMGLDALPDWREGVHEFVGAAAPARPEGAVFRPA